MDLRESIDRIKEVMGLITEAETTPQGFEINLSSVFESGKYVITPTVGSKINGAITQIKNFITKNPNKPILVTIESSESKVPNYDREKFPSTGDKNKDFTADKKLPVGALSKNRATNLSTYLKTKLPKNVTITIVDKGAQGPQWKAPFNAQDPNYTKFQYVKLYTKVNVPQPSTGTTTTTQVKNDPKVCNQQFEANGSVGNSSRGFISEEKIIQLGEGEGTFKFLLDSKSVPDIMIVEYNGKTQSTGFLGSNTELYQTLLGTIIYMRYDAYGNPRPWWFKDYKLIGVQPYHADQVLKKYAGDWQPTDFAHIWPQNPPLSTTFFQTMAKNPDLGFYPKKLDYDAIKTLGAGIDAWNSSSSLTIEKVRGVDTAKVTIIGPIGQTQWKLYVKCGDISPLMTTAGGPGGDIKR